MSQGGVGGVRASHRKRSRAEDVDDQEAVYHLSSEGGEEEKGDSCAQESVEEEEEEAGARCQTTQDTSIMSRMVSRGDYKVVVYMIGHVSL